MDCGAKTHARFPKDVAAPVQYGKRIAAFVVYLGYFQFVPEQRLAELMAALFGVRLTPATIARMGRDCAGRFGGFVEFVRGHVAAATLRACLTWMSDRLLLQPNKYSGSLL